MVRFVAKTSKCNFVDSLKINLYIVVEKPVSDIPVRTLHRNLLLPSMCISDNDVDSNDRFNYSVNKTGMSVI